MVKGKKMMVHNKGPKAARDRALLVNSYIAMCREFRIPKAKRLNAAEIAGLSNDKLYKVNKDLYAQATVKQAKKLAVKLGLIDKPESLLEKIKRGLYFLKGANHA
jgi:hypothetical protein